MRKIQVFNSKENHKRKVEEAKEKPDLQTEKASHYYSEEIVKVLKRWLENNRRNPYPKYLQRKELCK